MKIAHESELFLYIIWNLLNLSLIELFQNRPGASLKFSPGLRSYIHDTKEDPSFSTQRGEMPEGQPIGKLGSIIRPRIKKQLVLSCSETKSSFEAPKCLSVKKNIEGKPAFEDYFSLNLMTPMRYYFLGLSRQFHLSVHQ